MVLVKVLFWNCKNKKTVQCNDTSGFMISRSRLNDCIFDLFEMLVYFFLGYLSIWHIRQCLGEHISLCQWCLFIVCSHLLNQMNNNTVKWNKKQTVNKRQSYEIISKRSCVYHFCCRLFCWWFLLITFSLSRRFFFSCTCAMLCHSFQIRV